MSILTLFLLLLSFLFFETELCLTQWEEEFLKIPNESRLKNHLQTFTSNPHESGSHENVILADYWLNQISSAGIETFKSNYTGYLKYSSQVSVELISPSYYKAKLKEKCEELDKTSCHVKIIPPFIAYSAGGDVQSSIVYVNYGRVEDFDYLKQHNISVEGKIVLARYGRIFRGNKVMHAEQRGASAILIYSDPDDDGRGPYFPHGPWRSPTSVQRGSGHYVSLCPGDPMRTKICNVSSHQELIPKIPVHPLSYSDAEPFLRSLKKTRAPESWQGGLPFEYYIESNNAVAKVSVKTKEVSIPLINGHAFLRGKNTTSNIIVGSHRDAWTLGAVDPGSSSSIIVEVAKALGSLKKRGWMPKRSVYFMSWDGEELGQLGSAYWVESNEAMISKTTAAYFNLDTAVSGPFFHSSATPSLAKTIRNVTSYVYDTTLYEPIYDVWDRNVNILGSGSDFTSFLDYLGVPSSDVRYTSKFYGVYHSAYDGFYWMENFGDPGFKRHKAIAQVLGLMIMKFVDSTILPFDFSEYGLRLKEMLNFTINNSKQKGGENILNFKQLNQVIEEFYKISNDVNGYLVDQSKFSENDADTINDILTRIERQFLGKGLPGRGYYKHIVQAPGISTGYGAHFFPGINDPIDQIDWITAQKEINVASERIYSAAALLKTILSV